jgi:predicted transposase/invertase (TIGR01784 family)
MLADARDRWVTDHLNAMRHKYRQGKEDGREEGRYQEKLESARKMKQAGLPPEQIAGFTGLSPEEINA